MSDSATSLRRTETGDFNWTPLLRAIELRKVIPIIGPELLPYVRTLAAPLAANLGLTGQTFSDVGAVADAFLLGGRRSARLVAEELQTLLEAETTVPEALRQLVRIEQFRLFVTTDHGSALEEALRLKEPPESCRSLAYAQQEKPHDIEKYPDGERCVFHLLGHFGTDRQVALARVDQLEYFYDLQTERGPRGLMQVLAERRNLLFLGCEFPEWLASFFTRNLVGRPFYETRDRGLEIIASEWSHGNRGASSPLTAFLRANQMEVFPGDAPQFIEELLARYRPPPSGGLAAPAVETRKAGPAFISYSRLDKAETRTLAEQLRARHIEVWLDERDLTPGEDFAEAIQHSISAESSAFIAVISRRALEQDRNFFVREWRWALEVSRGSMQDVTFIFPVVIDDTDPSQVVAALRERFPPFASLNLEFCPGGKLADDRLAEALKRARKTYERVTKRG